MLALSKIYSWLITAGTCLQPLILLAVRLIWGWSFFQAGLSKLTAIDSIIGYFETLNIPFPTLSAYLLAWAECHGGAFLLIGFASRLVALPLMFAMFIAMLTAHHEAFVDFVNSPIALTQQTPFNYFLAALLIFAFGPGLFSIDGLIKKWTEASFKVEAIQRGDAEKR